MDIAVTLNRKMIEAHPSSILLDKKTFLPHISLAMGCLHADDVDRAYEIITSIAARYPPIKLNASHLNTVGTSPDETIVTLDFETNVQLIELHKEIVTAFQPILTHDATEAEVYGTARVEPSTIEWINNYIPQSCFDMFWPHITLGFGSPPEGFVPFPFDAARLAICHLGNYCACRKILREVTLR